MESRRCKLIKRDKILLSIRYLVKEYYMSASRVVQRSKVMHRRVTASLQPGVPSQTVSLPAVTGSPIGRSLVRVGGGAGPGAYRLSSVAS